MKIIAIATLCSAAILGMPGLTTACPAQSPNVTVLASGLAGPRGLKFGPDGNLYVAEAGFGGTNATTASQCTQVPGPIGPYQNGNTARISKIDKQGNRTTVASGFPSAVSSDPTKDTMGVADVAFLNGQLYAVTAGGGCSHGNASTPNFVARVDARTGNWTILADLSKFLQEHQAMYTDAADFEPDGVFYSLIGYQDRLYTVEPNHGQVFSISPGGEVDEAIDISEAEAHIVPTSIAERDGNFYVGNLGLFPITPDTSKILTLSPGQDGGFIPRLDFCQGLQKLRVAGSRAGFTTVVAVDFGPDGLLYALELSPAAGYPTPGIGKVVRLNRTGDIEDVATGLSLPTGMTFGPDGYLYVSNWGAAPAGNGQIIRITIP
jgi:glucose/arabinose dehydrogenase